MHLTQVRVIVACGNLSLSALTGFEGISKHRGSMYSILVGGRQVTCIPIIHPAAVLRGQAQWERRGYLDWERIARVAKCTDMSKHRERVKIVEVPKRMERVHIPDVPKRVERVIDGDIPPSIERVTTSELSKDGERVITSELSKDRERVTTSESPKKEERVISLDIPRKIERVTSPALPKTTERVNTRELPKEIERCYITTPTALDLESFTKELERASHLSIDIETRPSEGRMLCVGFSVRPQEGLVLEWTPEYLPWIRRWCAYPIDKVLWNGNYDRYWLATEGISVNGRILDGMHMLHALMPTDNVSLAFAASIETDEPFWKDQDKTEDNKTAEENWEEFKTYCIKDVCVALEITQKLLPQLEEQGLQQFYEAHYEELAEPMLDTMLQGVCIDHIRRRQVLHDLLTEARAARDKLATFNGGEPLFTLSVQRDKLVWAKLKAGLDPYEGHGADVRMDIQRSVERIQAKTVSSHKLKQLLYGRYGLPMQLKHRSSGEDTETSDIFTLRKLRYDYRDTTEVCQVIDTAIAHSKAQKLSSFIQDDKYDADGRMRFSLKVTTEAGRLASSASPRGKKNNSQNIPRDSRVRSLVLPEPGHVCLAVDGSAAEARVCFIKTKDPELIRLARLRSTEYDQHRHTGVIVGFAPSTEETPENFAAITRSQRQVCKQISHGSQRNMQGFTLAQTILREGLEDEHGNPIVFDEEYCNEVIERYHRRFPAIRQWHLRVRAAVRKDRCLTNSWGRIWPVPYYQLSDELFRRAYSCELQSETADWLNMWGFKALWQWIKANKLRSGIMLQEHDGLVISTPPDEAYDVALFLRGSLEQVREYDGVELAIPVEWTLGLAWGHGREWKILPPREEFETYMAGLLNNSETL